MSIYFRRTDQEYYVLTNYPELVRRARELGYKGVSLFTQDELDRSDIEQFKQINKSAIRILFRPDHREEDGLWTRERIDGTELHSITMDLAGNEIEGGKHIETLEDAIEHFPKPIELEKLLKNTGIIRETEYYNRCGHCHKPLGEDDKYCKYCGTERGKGEFLPFMNGMYCVYGPPVKMKYKCTACGHIWISGVLGGDDAKFCPQCGKMSLNVLENRASWGQEIGYEEPYDTAERPILLEEDEIVKLLNERKFIKKRKDHDDEIYIDREKILSALRKAGIDIPQKADYETYPRTEKEGEQINQANMILQLKGNNPKGCKDNCCPHCRSELVAALGYKVLGRDYVELAKSIHAPVGKDGLVYNGHDIIYYNKPESRNIDHPAFVCLKCGTEFGTLKIPKELTLLDKGQSAKKGAIEFGKDVVYAAVGAGVLAVDAMKKAAEKIGDVAKNVKDSRNRTKAKAAADAAAKEANCYAISVPDPEDVEITRKAVRLLKKAGYDSRIHIAGGTMSGYVFAKVDDFEDMVKLLKPIEGVTLNDKPVDKFMAELIRKHS